MKQSLLKAAAALAGAVMLCVSVPFTPAPTADAAGSVSIDTSTQYQIIRGFGGMNHPEWQSVNTQYGASGDMSAACVQTAFGNGEDELGLSILRIFISDDSNAWKNAIPTAQRAQALGATVFATPWNPPASMRSNGSGGPRGGQYVLNNGAEGQYAKHLNDFIKYCEGQNVHLNSVSVQNEPDWSGEWTYWTPDRAANFIANYKDAVVSGTTTKLMSPESFSYSKDYYDAILKNSAALKNCDLFGTHFYGTQPNAMHYDPVINSGKEIWMTEVYVPNSDANSADKWDQALQAAENIHNGMVLGNMSAYVWWYIRRQYSFLWDDGRVSKRGAVMAQYSKWVRPGDYRIAATANPETNVLVSAYKNDDGDVKVVAINKGGGAATENFTLTSGEKISEISAWHSTSTENFRSTSAPSYSDSSFSAQLPAQSVTTFVISTGEAEPDPNGYLFHYTFENSTDGFTGRGGASVATSSAQKYDGSQSLAVTGRESTWHGATHALPGKLKAGETYSFSAVVMQNTNASEKMHFSIEYKDASGETKYDKIATETVTKGDWVQLANTAYTIPAGATNVQLYFETDGDTGTTTSFYVDEVIAAPKGTVIEGPKAVSFKLGDLDSNGKINAADFTLMKRGLLKGFSDKAQELAADVTQDGTVSVADAVWYVKYLTGQIKEFAQSTVTQPDEPDQPQYNSVRMISEYTPVVAAQIKETESNSDRQKQGGREYGTLVDGKYYSEFCKREKPYVVLLPAGYTESKKYPVMYVMHGYWENQDRMCRVGNDTQAGMTTVEIVGNAIASGEAEEMILVFPYIYSSQSQDNCSDMDDANNQAYDNFEKVLINELMPLIESKYSVKTGKENTAITGFSMGGRESLNIGTKHADLFGYVGSICAAPGATPNFKWASEEDAPRLILMTAGSNDKTVYTTPEGYHNSATQANCPHIWHYVNGGYHGDNCIRAHLYNFVRAAFKA